MARRDIFGSRSGAAAVEYALLIAIVGGATALGGGVLRDAIRNSFNAVGTQISRTDR